MKILYVTTISKTIEFFVPQIKFLVDNGCQVDIACNVVREINPELIRLGCKVYDIEFQRTPLKKENYIAYKKLKNIVIDEGYDLVHVHTPIASFLTRMACRNISGLKVLYTAHGFHFFKGASFRNWIFYYTLERFAANFTDGLITMNDEDFNAAKNMKLKTNDSVYKVNGVGIDLYKYTPQTLYEKSKLRKDYGYNQDDFILFYAAEMNSNKHQDLLINVVNLIKDYIPNVKLLLAGNGILREQYEGQVNKLSLNRNVEFLGFRKDIPELLKIADVAVASSRREGLPVNIMEAMATGLPLVVTNCRGQRDLVTHDENGFVVEIEDTKGFADSVLKIYNSKELREKFRNSNLKAIEMYSIDNIIDEISGIYQRYLIKYK